MLSVPPQIESRLTAESGFTLVELLVVMMASVTVMTALFTIIDVTLHQTTRTFSRVDATQHARTTLARVESELQSSCVAAGATPIQTGSDGTDLIFISQEGSAASLTPIEHKISLTSTAGPTTLTDTTYAVNGGSAPDWTFSTTPTNTTILLTNVTGTAKTFQYFDYDEPKNAAGVPYTDAAGNPYMVLLDGTDTVPGTTTVPANALSPLTMPLSADDSASAAEVVFTFKVGPAGGTNETTTTPTTVAETVTDSVVLRVTAAANHAGDGADFSPCS
jgi:hypothetical protein